MKRFMMLAAAASLSAAGQAQPLSDLRKWPESELRRQILFYYSSVIYSPVAGLQVEAQACGDTGMSSLAEAELISVAERASLDMEITRQKLGAAQDLAGLDRVAYRKCDQSRLKASKDMALPMLDRLSKIAVELNRRGG